MGNKHLGEILAEGGQEDKVLEFARSVQSDEDRDQILSAIADGRAQAEHFMGALSILGLHEPDEFLETVASWAPYFDQMASGLSIPVLREVTSILGWLHPDWRKIHRLLST